MAPKKQCRFCRKSIRLKNFTRHVIFNHGKMIGTQITSMSRSPDVSMNGMSTGSIIDKFTSFSGKIILNRGRFFIVYNKQRGRTEMSVEVWTKGEFQITKKAHSTTYTRDPSVGEGQMPPKGKIPTNFQRGHLSAKANNVRCERSFKMCFYGTNLVLMHTSLNQGPLRVLEWFSRILTKSCNLVVVFSLCIYDNIRNPSLLIDGQEVPVPAKICKVIYIFKDGSPITAMIFIFPNDQLPLGSSFFDYLTTFEILNEASHEIFFNSEILTSAYGSTISTYQCKDCESSFVKTADLILHRKHAHAIIKCPHCEQQFTRKTWLISHLRIHKKFKCKVCRKIFMTRTSLATHVLRYHHSGTYISMRRSDQPQPRLHTSISSTTHSTSTAQHAQNLGSFPYFKRDADELESWIYEKLQAASDETFKCATNLQAHIHEHQAFVSEVSDHSNAIVSLDNTGHVMISQGLHASDTIKKRLEELHRLWELLLSRLAERGLKLQQALVLVQFLRSCNEVIPWITNKTNLVIAEDVGTDLEHVEVLQRKFDEFQKEMASEEYRVMEVNTNADKLINDRHPEHESIQRKREELNDSWQLLQQVAVSMQQKLIVTREIQRFNWEADEAIDWIKKNDLLFNSDEYGRDLSSIRALIRKHEGDEADLAALHDKVNTLGAEAERLCGIHGDHAEQIRYKHEEIVGNWEGLVEKAKSRKCKLDDSYSLHRFLSEYRDLVNWINDMKQIISADDLAKDVAGAEALLERHQEHKGEIDAREDSFKLISDSGSSLVERNHFAASEVAEKLNSLSDEKIGLLSLWEDRRVLYEQCMDLQLFYRDTEQADTWMAKQEAFLENTDLGDSLDSVEALIKKHEDFEKSLAAHEEKIKALDELACKLIEGLHYAWDNVSQRRALILRLRKSLHEKSEMRRSSLNAAFKLMRFVRACDKTNEWIKCQLKYTNDESYLDPRFMSFKIQTHANFMKELQANKTRIDEMLESGRNLIDSSHYGSDRIEARVEEIVHLWKQLEEAGKKKESRLAEASAQQQFNRTIEDIELWLSEVEAQLTSEDYGKDLTSVQNLQKKHQLLESDVSGHQDRVDVIMNQAQEFIEVGHFDKDNIQRKAEGVEGRYNALMNPIEARRKKLSDSLRVNQLFRDIEDEEAWIREKEPIASSENMGKDLNEALDLIQTYLCFTSELDKHEAKVNIVCERGDNIFNADNVSSRIGKLREQWNVLRDKATKRKNCFASAILVHKYNSKATKAESWMKEKEPLVLSQDLGKDDESFESLLKKNEALMSDLEAFKSTIEGLRSDVCKFAPAPGCSIKALYDYKKITPSEISIKKGSLLLFRRTSSDKKWCLVEGKDCKGFVPLSCVRQIDSASKENLADPKSSIQIRQNQIESQYSQLLNLGHNRQQKLSEACKAYVLVREAAELGQWNKDKEQYAQVQVAEVPQDVDPEQVEVMQKNDLNYLTPPPFYITIPPIFPNIPVQPPPFPAFPIPPFQFSN